MAFEPYAARTHEKMLDVLMKPDAQGPAIHYYMVRGGKNKRNITVLETGTAGGLPAAPGRPAQAGEYIKTYGHYHIGALDETYWFLAGEGVALLQKLTDQSDPSVVAEFKAIQVKAGDSVYMPAGYGHLMLNTGKTWLVMEDDSPVEGPDDSASMPGHADYEAVKQMRGFAYYVVEKDGKPALVPNKLYKEVKKTDFGGLPVVGN
ncbi:MAG: glucose-6-phosphate isomerase family protein [Patescibacteria group bacterium]